MTSVKNSRSTMSPEDLSIFLSSFRLIGNRGSFRHRQAQRELTVGADSDEPSDKMRESLGRVVTLLP